MSTGKTQLNIPSPALASRFRHNILQPVAAVQTLLAQSQKEALSRDDRIKLYAIMTRALGEFVQDLGNLTMFMQFEYGTVETRINRFNLQDTVIEGITSRIDSAIFDERLRIVIDDQLVIETDQALLMAAVRELVVNAVEFSRDVIEIYTELSDGVIVIGVRDHGEGVADEVIASPQTPFQVYEPMKSSRPTRLGLGLPLAFRIAGLLGGKLRVDTGFDGGADVRISLPYAASI